jgi:predicted Zn-dependent peptidase
MSESVKMIEANGIKVPMIFEESRFLPLVSMQIVFKDSGAISDTKSGLALLSAKMLSEGTRADGSVKFATKLENHAIHLSASAGNETFTITLSSLKSEFEKGVLLLKSLLKDPNYTQETIDRIKKKQIGWLTQQESNFDYVASLGLKKTLFRDTPLSRARAGNKDSITSITLEDIQNFISTHLGINNAIVVIGGDINLNDAKKYTISIMESLPTIEYKKLPYIKATDKKITNITKEDTQQAYIYFGAPYSLKYSDPQQHISKVANYILGGSGFGSRLMEEIRVKRGLAYSAYSRFVVNRTTSYLSGYLQTKLENEKEAKELVEQIVDEFVENGVTQKELDAAKEFLIGSEPLRNETLSQRVDRAYNEYYYNRPLGYQKEQLKRIESLTLEEINSFIKSHKEITNLSFSIVTAKK